MNRWIRVAVIAGAGAYVLAYVLAAMILLQHSLTLDSLLPVIERLVSIGVALSSILVAVLALLVTLYFAASLTDPGRNAVRQLASVLIAVTAMSAIVNAGTLAYEVWAKAEQTMQWSNLVLTSNLVLWSVTFGAAMVVTIRLLRR